MSVILSDSMKSESFFIDPFGAARTAEKTTLIDIKPFHCVSDRRDVIVTTGTGSVDDSDALFAVAIAGSSDSASLTSLERGEYVAGSTAEVGVALQVDPEQFTGDQTLKFGYFDDSDGFFYVISSDGLSMARRIGGVTTNIPQASWNGDYRDNDPPDVSKGLIYRINFSYYGFGCVLFSVNYASSTGSQISRLLHSFAAESGLSCENPHLPIRVELAANGSADPVTAYVAGRQYSVIGRYTPTVRVTSHVASAEVTDSASYTCLFSLRRKTSFLSTCAMVSSFDVMTTQPILIRLVSNATLTGSTFALGLDGVAACESGLEADEAASAAADGVIVYTCIASGTSTVDLSAYKIKFLEMRPITLLAKCVSDDASVHVCLRVVEHY